MEEQIASENIPVFQRIKDYLLAGIAAGRWKEGDVIPSEHALLTEFKVSRMTVNRAMRELTAEQVLTRRQGAGTYVAPQKYQATLLEIKNIADEIRARGHRHGSTLLRLEQVAASDLLAAQFGLPRTTPLFHSLIVHEENEAPIQVEDRWVNPACAPDYLEQDFSAITPHAYLMVAAPLHGASYRIEALAAPRAIAALLAIEAGQPCLVLRRQTSSHEQVASVATLWHPGLRYQFTGRIV